MCFSAHNELIDTDFKYALEETDIDKHTWGAIQLNKIDIDHPEPSQSSERPCHQSIPGNLPKGS